MTATRWLYALGTMLMVGFVFLAGLWAYHARPRDSVAIHWHTTHQTIDGFGASASGYVGAFTPQQADQFFNIDSGLGLSLLRLAIVPDTVKLDCGCVSNNAHYECVVGPKSQILSGDLRVAQLATARGVRLTASPWSPPAEMKSSGKFCGGGAMLGNPANYAEYGARLASFPSLLKEHGVSIDSMSVQNEPDVENEKYDTCRWNAQQVHDFVPYLSDALAATGFGQIQIAVPEESEWTFDLLDPTMRDPKTASQIGLVMGHAYRAEQPSGLPQSGGRHVWQTEASGYEKFDGSMKDGIGWAHNIHNYLTIGTNAWLFWNLDCGEQFYNKDNNMCLSDHQGRLAKRAYVLGQFAKFVRPGWRRIGVTNRGTLLITAYKGPENKFAVVVVNDSWWAVRKQAFEVQGIGRLRTPITPWITSASASLEKQVAVSANAGGTEFVYTIPASSVVTFEGQADEGQAD